MKKRHIDKDEHGYIVVETVGTFVPFILLVVSILSLVNIMNLQARIHNALTQTANSLSMYCYILKVTGKADELIDIRKKSETAAETVDSVLKGISGLTAGCSNGEMIIDAFSGTQNAQSDSDSTLDSFLNYGISELINGATEVLVTPMLEKYLANGDVPADEYLSRVRVKNFQVAKCVILDSNANVKITVEYEIEYSFGALKFPFGSSLKVTQTAVTKAWLAGSGEGYRW